MLDLLSVWFCAQFAFVLIYFGFNEALQQIVKPIRVLGDTRDHQSRGKRSETQTLLWKEI